MSPLSTRRYRVMVLRWDAYDAVIEADSEEDALAKAEALYSAEGEDAFSHHDGGLDGITAEPLDEEAGS